MKSPGYNNSDQGILLAWGVHLFRKNVPVGPSKSHRGSESMMYPVSVLAAALLICSAQPGQAQNAEAQTGHATPPSDHIISDGPSGPLESQIRYLLGHWPLDSEIAVVQALTDPHCNQRSHHCSLRVKPVNVILGRQRETSYIVWYGPARHCKDDVDNCVYVYDPVQFDAKRGDRMVALLSAAIRQPQHPVEYIANRLDRADDATVESARKAVAGVITAGARCQLGGWPR